MTVFEVLVLGGLGAVIFFLFHLEKTLETILSTCERWHLESTVRDNMPTLWSAPEFSHDCLVIWFDIANGPYSKSLREKWHWPTLEDNLTKTNGPRRWEIPSEEIERLKNLSTDFFKEAKSAYLLTDSEIEYLLFYAWNSNLMFPDMITPDAIVKFESELSDMRQRFLHKSYANNTQTGG